MSKKLIAFIAVNLQPNRVTLYLTTAADVLALVIVLAGDLGVPQVAAVLATVGAINAKALKFVTGHQNMESALYQRDLIAYQANVQADLNAQRADAVAAASRPGGKTNGLTLPR